MRRTLTILVCLFSFTAFCGDSAPNTQARFFLTIAKYLSTSSMPHDGLHPHEDLFKDYGSNKYHDAYYYTLYSTNYLQTISYYYFVDYAFDYDPASYYRNYGSEEVEIVPGIFAKTGKQILDGIWNIKVGNYRDGKDLFIEYRIENVDSVIESMIKARKLSKPEESDDELVRNLYRDLYT